MAKTSFQKPKTLILNREQIIRLGGRGPRERNSARTCQSCTTCYTSNTNQHASLAVVPSSFSRRFKVQAISLAFAKLYNPQTSMPQPCSSSSLLTSTLTSQNALYHRALWNSNKTTEQNRCSAYSLMLGSHKHQVQGNCYIYGLCSVHQHNDSIKVRTNCYSPGKIKIQRKHIISQLM